MTEGLARASDLVVMDNGTPALMLLLRNDPFKTMRGTASNAIVGLVVSLVVLQDLALG